MHEETAVAPWRAGSHPEERLAPTSDPERRALVDRLQERVSSEYGAILQYLHHAFAVPAGEVSFPSFGHSRDAHRQLIRLAVHEMRHAEMLARTLARLGAGPTVAAAPQAGAATWGELMEREIAAEGDAADRYEDLARAADDPQTSYMLANIAHDERGHILTLSAILGEVRRRGMAHRPHRPGAALYEAVRPGGPARGTPGEAAAAGDGRLLAEAAGLEYRALWNLIYHSMVLGDDQSLAPRLRALATKEMRHWHGLTRRAMELGADIGGDRPVDTMGFLDPDPRRGLEDALALAGGVAVRFNHALGVLTDPAARQMVVDYAAEDREHSADLEAYLGNLHRRSRREGPAR